MSCYFSNHSGFPLDSRPFCGKGFYCPGVFEGRGNRPVLCPPSSDCERQRIRGFQCQNIENSYGAQGRNEPVLCPKGRFCSEPNTIKVCPEGFYCPSGTFEPIKCDLVSICPEGSIWQKSMNGFVICAILDLLILVLYFMYWNNRKRLMSEYRNHDQHKFPLPKASKTQIAKNFVKSMDGETLKMRFKMDNVSIKLPNGRFIFQDLSLKIHAGKMTAIMGPSGVGKTTLLNVLLGKIQKTSGRIWISGKEVELSGYKKIYGFVPQTDLIHHDLTVRQNIEYSATVRLPSSWSHQDRQTHVNAILNALNLRSVQHNFIGDVSKRHVSGGQMKRVSLGMELAASPLCLTLDEPTTGLDASAALEITSILSNLASLGMTVVSIIHQPRLEIFYQFDEVIMLVEGGIAYAGSTKAAKAYFQELGYVFRVGTNEADVYSDIMNGTAKSRRVLTPMELIEKWKLHLKCAVGNTEVELGEIPDSGIEMTQRKKPRKENVIKKANDEQFHQRAMELYFERGSSFWRQVVIVHNFSVLQQLRNISNFLIELVVGTTIGVFLGSLMDKGDEIYSGVLVQPFTLLSPAPNLSFVVQFIFLTGLAVAFSAAPSGTAVFSEEMNLYYRKVSSGHSALAYFLGKSIATMYRIVLCSIHFASALYFISAPVIPFWIHATVIGLFYFGVYGLCSFVSMLSRSENATLLAVIVSLFSAVFCGYGPTLKQSQGWGISFIWWFMFNTWGTEALYSKTLNVYRHVYDSDACNLIYGFGLDREIFDLFMMVLLGVFWRVLAYFAMTRLNKDKQK